MGGIFGRAFFGGGGLLHLHNTSAMRITPNPINQVYLQVELTCSYLL